MRVLQINSVYGYGSTGKIVRSIHEALLSGGNESYVIYGRTSAIGRQSGSTVADNNVLYIHHSIEQKMDLVTSYIFDTHGLHSQKNTQAVIAKIRELQPDVIHLHNIHGFYLNYPMLFQFLKEYDHPVIWTLHDCWSFTGYCAYYDYCECDGWKSGCTSCKYKQEYPYRVLSHSAENFNVKKNTYADFDKLTFVTPSKWLKEELQQSMLKDRDCVVIHNDVNLNHFYHEKGNVLSDNKLIGKRIYLAVANVWNNQKGYEEYLKFAELLTEDEVLVMIGLSEKQQKEMQGKGVLAIGSVDADTLRHWYSSCDCYVNLTLEDNYPTVNLEARSCGAPIVTYATGGSPESAGENAIVVSRHDTSAALSEARLAQHDENTVLTDNNRMCENYIDLYRKVNPK